MFNFIKQFMVIDQKTNEISHTKFWSNVGYGIMCFTFVYAVIYGSQIEYELWLLFGVVVIGNRTIKRVMLDKEKTEEQ